MSNYSNWKPWIMNYVKQGFHDRWMNGKEMGTQEAQHFAPQRNKD